jgi:hypothetical protein
MNLGSLSKGIRYILGAAVALLISAYFALVLLKSPFDFSDPEFEAPACGHAQAQMVIENEPYDHFRTAAVSLLLGLLIANALLSNSPAQSKRFAAAILASSALVVASTFLGISPLAVQPSLLLVALYACCVAAVGIKAGRRRLP